MNAETAQRNRALFSDALLKRRTYLSLSNELHISPKAVSELIKTAITATPSYCGAQSTRALVLFGEHHDTLWEITKRSIRSVAGTSEDAARGTERIDRQFKAAAGTVCFFQDLHTVKQLEDAFTDNVDLKAAVAARLDYDVAAAELAVWMVLRQANIGSSLQHFNPIIDEGVRVSMKIPKWWRMHSQMPFGGILVEPSTKVYLPLDDRIRVFDSDHVVEAFL